MTTRLWLERDDESAKAVAAAWRFVAKQHTDGRYPHIDYSFFGRVLAIRSEHRARRGLDDPETSQLNAMRAESLEDTSDRPWIKRKPLFPLMATSDTEAAAALVASLDTHRIES